MFREFQPIIDIVAELNNILVAYGSRDVAIQTKDNDSPVTEADFKSNELITATIQQYFPNHGLLSEEAPDDGSRFTQEFVWCVDPLDGTKDFIHKTGDYSILVGLLKNGRPYFGCIGIPETKELFVAKEGEGAFHSQEGSPWTQIHCRQKEDLHTFDAAVSRFHISEVSKDILKDMGCHSWIPVGSIGIKVARIAQGKLDLYFNTSGKANEWDTCAPEILLQEAGGTMTDLGGNSLEYNQKDVQRRLGIVGSNGCNHLGLLPYLDAQYHNLKNT